MLSIVYVCRVMIGIGILQSHQQPNSVGERRIGPKYNQNIFADIFCSVFWDFDVCRYRSVDRQSV